MIDIENKVFDRVKTAILESYPTAYVKSEYVRNVPQFPAIFLEQMDNTVNFEARSLSKIENAVDVMFELQVYSNKSYGKKSECKNIVSLVDDEMQAMGFTRTSYGPQPNLDDATIYRMVARFEKIETGDL